MIVTPLRPQRRRPAALLVPGYRALTVFTDDGITRAKGPSRSYDLLKKLEGFACYTTGSVRPMLISTGARAWTADVWRGRAVSLKLYGAKVVVHSLRRTLEGLPPDEAYDALNEVLDVLADLGVRAGSVSSMSWSLWRATLSSPVNISSDPRVSRRALYGARQEAQRPQRVETPVVAVDLMKAYPSSMAGRPYAGLLRRVSPSTRLDPEVAGLVEARVSVPDDAEHPFPPLPKRLAPQMIQWPWGDVEGVWPWGEVVAARELGCDVEVKKVWAPATTLDLFSNWYAYVRRADELAPRGAKLLKAIANNLWGCFAMSGDERATVTWADDLGFEPEIVARPPRRMPHLRTAHVAAETTSRVRVRMLREALYGGVGEPLHVDTDGYLIDARYADRVRVGEGPGQWRIKTRMRVLDLKGPQLYRYLCGEGCGITHEKWHVVAAGIPGDQAREFFDRVRHGFSISYHGLDAVVPSGRELDPVQVALYRSQHDQVHSLAYGDPIGAEVR